MFRKETRARSNRNHRFIPLNQMREIAQKRLKTLLKTWIFFRRSRPRFCLKPVCPQNSWRVVCTSQLKKQTCGHFIDKCFFLNIEQYNITYIVFCWALFLETQYYWYWFDYFHLVQVDSGSMMKRLPDGEDNTRVSPNQLVISQSSSLTIPSLGPFSVKALWKRHNNVSLAVVTYVCNTL